LLTAFENVELPLLLAPLSKAERKKHVETALTLVGLADRMRHYPRQLSGGRASGWRSRGPSPPIPRSSWPTSDGDLDRKSAEEVLTLLERLNKEFKKNHRDGDARPHAASARTSYATWTRANCNEGPAVKLLRLVFKNCSASPPHGAHHCRIATAVMAFGLIRTIVGA